MPPNSPSSLHARHRLRLCVMPACPLPATGGRAPPRVAHQSAARSRSTGHGGRRPAARSASAAAAPKPVAGSSAKRPRSQLGG
eukprot:352450-Chlamydomonas_euryale.AAC.3